MLINQFFKCIIIILFSLIWSSAFIAGLYPVQELGVYLTLSIRFLLSSVILAIVAGMVFKSLTEPNIVKKGIILGLFNNIIYLGCTFAALKYINPGWVIIIVSFSPFFTLIFSILSGEEKFNFTSFTAFLLGISGVFIIVHGSLSYINFYGITLAIIGTISFSAGTVFFKKKCSEYSTIILNFWQTFISGIILLLLYVPNFDKNTITISLKSIISIIYLSTIVTIGGMALWFYLIKKSGPKMAAMYHLINPFFGVILSHIFFHSGILPKDIVGITIISISIGLATLTKIKEDTMINNHGTYSFDVKSFFEIKNVQKLKHTIEITLSGKSYLPKFNTPESDWISRVAVPAFKIISGTNYSKFCSIGTGSGIDALAAIEILGSDDITLTDIHQEVIDRAIYNVKNNIICDVDINGFVGDILCPLVTNKKKYYDIIYENLPNIPLFDQIDLYDGQNSSTYIKKRNEILPQRIDRNLISLHSIALHQAKSILSKNGKILSSIGGRIPIKDILYLAEEAGYEGSVILYSWKIQSEPEDVVKGYYHYEQQGYGPFHFYPINALIEAFKGVTPAGSGELALEIEQKLIPHRMSVEEALKKTAQRLPVGHTVVVLQSTFRY